MSVRSYRNLNVHDRVAYSVMVLPARKVRAEKPSRVLLSDVELKVSEAGRDRVLREKRRGVHAFAEGTFEPRPRPIKGPWLRFRYNPYLFATFVLAANLRPVTRAKYVLLDDEGAWLILHPEDEHLAASVARTTRSNPGHHAAPRVIADSETERWAG